MSVGNLAVGADMQGELYVLMMVCTFPPGPCALGTPFPQGDTLCCFLL